MVVRKNNLFEVYKRPTSYRLQEEVTHVIIIMLSFLYEDQYKLFY